MVEQAQDFRDESDALCALVSSLEDRVFSKPTQFKGWTIDEVMAHLHLWNRAAAQSLTDEPAFLAFSAELKDWFSAKKGKDSMRQFELEQVGGLQGQALVRAWRDYYQEMAEQFAAADPKQRVKWVGPDMSVRSSITARLMETWAHAQAIYDILGIARTNKDRIKNIVVLGINTYGWTFQVRGTKALEPKPYVKLTAPSGALWQWGEPSAGNIIEGAAEDFCQVVTQTRNIKDVNLNVKGDKAQAWMAQAQCFAGGAQEPPAAEHKIYGKA